jgi:hypothetical protein
MDAIQLAALLSGLILVASIASVELGVTVALIELALGVAVGNTFDLHSQEWLDFLATFGSIVLTFLAGMESIAPICAGVRRPRSGSASPRSSGRSSSYPGCSALAWASVRECHQSRRESWSIQNRSMN